MSRGKARRRLGFRGPARPGGSLLALGLAIGLAGCAGALHDEVARQDATLSDLRRSVDGLGTEVRGLQGDIVGLRSAVEGGLGQAKRAREAEGTRIEAEQEALAARLATVERRVEEMADAVTGVEVALAALAEQFARLEAGSASAVTLPGSRPPRPRQGGPPISAEELFDRGMESFRAGELGQSVLDFEEFSDKHPGHPLAASAQFWIGEAYFRSRDFEQAASKYQKAIDLAATGERTPDALLRLGLALRTLRREDRARDVWARLIREFPDSEAALRARAVLRQPSRAVNPADPR
ncbi:MAG TPA: tetratricopeptide repeat protein [Methylomirabilota bacterium]|nr:tetratricopeptide repeat protein [Methylomirabilota bacterium]